MTAEPTFRGPIRSVFRATTRFVVTVAVVVYTILDVLLSPLLRPLLRWLAQLRLFEMLGAALARLPPYAALVLLLVPFILIEPLKVLALVWAVGQPIEGLLLLAFAHVLSILILERIYHAAYAPLMRIGWFRRLMDWLTGLRDRAVAWARSTPAWQSAARLARRVRDWFHGVIDSLR